jgi:hypothetical protein
MHLDVDAQRSRADFSYCVPAANLGIVQSDLGKYDEAIKSFEQSMQLSPLLAEAPKCLGDTYKHVHRFAVLIICVYMVPESTFRQRLFARGFEQ